MIQNSAAVLSIGMAVRAVGFCAFVMLSRGLRPDELGTFALVVMSVELARQLIEMGTNTATVQQLAGRERSDWGPTVAAGLALRLLLAVLAFALIAAVALHPALRDRAPLFWLGGVTLFTGAVTAALTAPFQASRDMPRLVPFHLAAAAVYLGLVTWGVLHHWGVVGFLAALVAQEVLVLACTAARFAGRYPLRLSGLVARARTLARSGAALGLLGVIVLLYFRLDIFMLEAMRGSEAVGQYALAFRITEALLLLAGAVSASAFPRFVELRRSGSDVELARAFARVYRSVVVVGAVVAVGVSFSAPLLLPRFLPAYTEAAALIAVLGWSTVFMFANIQTADLLVAVGRTRTVTIVAAVNLGVNVAANLLLIPRYGAMGAAIATVVTEGANTGIQALYVQHRLGIALPWRVWIPTLALASLPLAWYTLGASGLTTALFLLGAGLALRWMTGSGPRRIPTPGMTVAVEDGGGTLH